MGTPCFSPPPDFYFLSAPGEQNDKRNSPSVIRRAGTKIFSPDAIKNCGEIPAAKQPKGFWQQKKENTVLAASSLLFVNISYFLDFFALTASFSFLLLLKAAALEAGILMVCFVRGFLPVLALR